MTADDIHEFGMSEVVRIQGEMRGIMKAVDFTGDLKAFSAHLKEDPAFYYP